MADQLITLLTTDNGRYIAKRVEREFVWVLYFVFDHKGTTVHLGTYDRLDECRQHAEEAEAEETARIEEALTERWWQETNLFGGK